MAELKQRGIGTQVHYIPLYRQPFHRAWAGRKISRARNAITMDASRFRCMRR